MNIRLTCTVACIVTAMVCVAVPAMAQKPTIFDVSDVVVGASRIETRYLFAEGKWSDAGSDVGPVSTQIQCYKRLGFCDIATANMLAGQAIVDLDSFDILRWDDKEIIAVDSSPICMVNTLRADLITKRVTMSSAGKGVIKDPLCKGSDKLPTSFLLGEDDIIKAIYSKKPKK